MDLCLVFKFPYYFTLSLCILNKVEYTPQGLMLKFSIKVEYKHIL